MNLTKDKIKEIEQVSIAIKKWADNLSYNPPCATFVQLTPSWCYKKEILLLCAKTNLSARLERDFADLDQLHQEYKSWHGKNVTEDNEEEFHILIDSLKGSLYDLAETLQQIAQIARKERRYRIVKLTFYVTSSVVLFLAALLTCIYILWWLRTTFWKK